MSIALIGYRGSGKSAVARLVAERLGWDWADADAVLEERAGRTIRDIFADEGEAGFRQRETAILAELSGRDQCVLALGGGVVIRAENRQRLSALFVVWLRADPHVLHARITADAQTASRRPGLTAGGGLEEIRTVLAQRTPWYQACADCIIDTDDRTPDQIAEQIVASFAQAG
jgi:shikimate kinase